LSTTGPLLGEDTLVFIHLPKTGGTALRSSLQQTFDPAASVFIYGQSDLDGAITRQQFTALPDASMQGLRLVMGHFPFGIHERIGRPCRYVTLARDPADRVVSLYYHYRNLPGIRFGGKSHRERLRLRWRGISLEDWVFGEQRIAADNVMVRNVSATGRVPFGGCTDAIFDQAMENVERHFVALLVTEEMERSVTALNRVIGRDMVTVGHENMNPNRPPLEEIDPVVLARIRELNRFDGRFHEAAKEWLERATAAQQPE
jgi:hypothetical protein